MLMLFKASLNTKQICESMIKEIITIEYTECMSNTHIQKIPHKKIKLQLHTHELLMSFYC